MKTTELLRAEHTQIKRMLTVLEYAADGIESGNSVPLELLKNGIEFVREYADKTHHGKEEDLLFPWMLEHGVPKEGPIGVMMTEHVSGRNFIAQLDRAVADLGRGDESVKGTIVDAVRGYTALLRRHIQKEDMILFRLADQILTDEEDEKLFQQFCRVDKDLMSDEKRQAWRVYLDRYEGELQLPDNTNEDVQAGCLAFLQDPDEAVDLWSKELKKR